MSQRQVMLCGFVVIIMLFTTIILHAQDDSCPEVVDFALASVNESCSMIDRNSACYGYNFVDATFAVDVDDDFFTQPADIAPLIDLETVQTASLDEQSDIWGIAVLKAQADLPNMLPGQSVVIVLMGDAEIQNQVDPETAFIGADPITVTTTASATNIRTAPTTSALVLGSVGFDTSFETDGQSTDGDWIRIIYDDRPAWISKSLVNQADGLNDLPLIQSEQYSPMQAFYFSTGVGRPTCNRAPNSIMIQGPDNIEVTVNVNGADITIGSTIVLRNSDENTMQVQTVSGSALVDGIVIPRGFTVSQALDTNGTAISGRLSDFRPLSNQELSELEVLQNLNPEMLEYTIEVPTRAEIVQLQNAITNRENAIQACREAELSAEQCLRIIGNDGDLPNRLQRCLDAGLSQDLCQRIISRDLNATTIIRCINEGFRTEEACRTATQERNESTFQSFCESNGATTESECQSLCESQGYTTQEACQTAAVQWTESYQSTDSPLRNVCEAQGATTASECQSLCQSQGYTSLEDCQNAATQTIQSQQPSSSSSSNDSNSSSTVQEQISNFCQSIGASTQSQCVSICQSNGYMTASACRDGMG